MIFCNMCVQKQEAKAKPKRQESILLTHYVSTQNQFAQKGGALLLLRWRPSSQNTRQFLAAHPHHCINYRSNGQNEYYREDEN